MWRLLLTMCVAVMCSLGGCAPPSSEGSAGGAVTRASGVNSSGGGGGTGGVTGAGGGGGGGGGGGSVQAGASIRRTPAGTPLVRVRVLQGVTSVRVSARNDPMVRVLGGPGGGIYQPVAMAGRTIVFSPATGGTGGWSIGGAGVAGSGTLEIQPRPSGSVAVNGVTYRGTYRLVPTGGGRFDVVNDVDIDEYLLSVVSRELYKSWHPETYRAQAVAARTYALYELATSGAGTAFDVEDDERSQVYGGVAYETPTSRDAVLATRGVVLTYGQGWAGGGGGGGGGDRIFKTYFSSCCGGLGQNPVDAFITDPPLAPLAEKNPGTLCSESPRYYWGPVVISKAELTRRLRVWGQRRGRAEAGIATVRSIEASHVNRLGRPVRYLVTDSAGGKYSLAGEELRTAINTDAGGAGGGGGGGGGAGGGRMVYSGWMTVTDAGRGSFSITGRGSGHAVGMCQYCAEALARRGWRHEAILRYSYPGAMLVRGY